MRLLLTFQLHQEVLPIETRRLVLSYIKQALKHNNLALFDKLYNGSATMKDMVFSTYYPIKTFKKEEILLKKPMMTLRIGTSDLSYGIQLYNALQAQIKKDYTYKHYGLCLEKIILEKERPIFHEVIRVKMQSPLLVRKNDDEKDVYLLPEDLGFQEQLNKILTNQLEQLCGQQESMQLRIQPIQTKKVVVRHYGQYIDGALGEFLLEGHPSLLNYLYNSGIGSRRSYGYGMFEIL